jgi:hypothetical protein
MADEQRPTAPEGTAAAPPPAQFATDTSHLSTVYTNFCRVSVTPEELVLDFGLNTQLTPVPTEPVRLSHRVVMNFFTAKRLMNALLSVINQYESTYGVLELDFQRRARGRGPGGGLRPPGGATQG